INTRKEVAAHLETLKDDREAFDAYLKIFETELFNSDFTTTGSAPIKRNVALDTPSNAPLGDAKSMTVTLKDGKIDYSAYRLKGDVNGDSIVDFSDITLLNDAIFTNYYTSDYDVNSDSKIDLADIIDVSARLLTEIGYFDFYTTAGVKLDIATRSAQAEKIFSYDGTATQVMVVAKDTNMVSSFATGLSDLDEVWYKQEYVIDDVTPDYSSSMKENTLTRATRSETCTYIPGPRVPPKVSSIKHSLLRQAIAFAVDAQPEEHLTGWNFSVRYGYRGNWSDQDSGLLHTDFTDAKKTVDLHFAKADMGIPPDIRLSTEKEFVYTAGRRMGITTKVSADHSIHNDAICTKEGKRIRRKYIILASSVLSISNPIYALTGTVEGEPFKGKLFLHRIGPTPAEKDFEALIEGKTFSAPFLPYGEFTVKAETECGCELQLSDKFIFTDTTSSVSISNPSDATQEVYLSLDVKDKEQKKIEGAEVTIIADECAVEAFTDSATTDSNGNVRFENLKPASYKVLVDGKPAKTILICANTNTVVNIVENPLWKFHTTFTSSFPGSGSMTIKKFPIEIDKMHESEYFDIDEINANLPAGEKVTQDFIDNLNAQGTPAFIVFVGNDYQSYPENTTISYSGLAYDSGLSPLLVSADGVDWSALKFVDGVPEPYQIGSMSGTSGAVSGLDCPGTLPADFESKVISGEPIGPWTSSGYENSCTFLFEPCQNEACD
ncbi:MAG: SpaA isopeptide-forming pilin-related protein, partial [Campylobacterota bacterium]|nr:SpaA isopeptide-forming pilin-related protein [Campylobacterota bacterium]